MWQMKTAKAHDTCSSNKSLDGHASTVPTADTVPSATEPATTAPSKNYRDFLNELGMRESSNIYSKKNQFGYLGRYQMGNLALQDAGFMNGAKEWTSTANSYGVYSEADFLNNPAAQDAAIAAYHTKVCGYIRNYGLDSYIGTVYCGVEVTQSGLLAACHLVGIGNMRDALPTGAIKYDGNGVPASQYMDLFGGYDISEVW